MTYVFLCPCRIKKLLSLKMVSSYTDAHMNQFVLQLLKSWVFLAALSITLIVFGHHWGSRDGLLLALVVVLAANSHIYFNEDRRLLARFGGSLAEGQDSWGLGEMVRRLSLKARIGAPRLVILNEEAPQSAVVGRNIHKGTVILTEGLIRKLTRPELEAVIAFQIASIRAFNTLTYSV